MKSKYLTIVMAVLLTLAFVAGAFPHNASAAVKCVAYYTVKEGDTTPKISHVHGLKWRDIADANDLERAWKPEEGVRLCIPAGGSVSTSTDEESTGLTTTTSVPSDSRGKFTAEVYGNRIYITTTNFANRRAYYLKVRDAEESIGGWEKLGSFKASKNTTETRLYTLPKDLRDAFYLDVCLKNATTDDLVCNTVLHLY